MASPSLTSTAPEMSLDELIRGDLDFILSPAFTDDGNNASQEMEPRQCAQVLPLPRNPSQTPFTPERMALETGHWGEFSRHAQVDSPRRPLCNIATTDTFQVGDHSSLENTTTTQQTAAIGQFPRGKGVREVTIADPAKPTSRISAATTRASSSRWTQREEVILQGVIIDCTLACGGQSTWEEVCRCYNIAVSRVKRNGSFAPLPKRTVCALKKHYRLMHSDTRKKESPGGFWFKIYHETWMSSEFNKDQRLLQYRDIIQNHF